MSKSKKALVIVAGVFSFLLVFFMVINMVPKSQVVEGVNPFKKEDVSLISAHRGGASINPENTQKAFDYVIKETDYVDIVEFDIYSTSDGEYVIIHDSYINRVGIDGDDIRIENEEEVEYINVKEHTYSELRKYNLGVNFVNREKETPYKDLSLEEAEEEGLLIMTLTDFLSRYKEVRDFKLFIEIKDTDEEGIIAADYLYHLLTSDEFSWYLDRTMIISFDDTVTNYISDKYKDLYVAPLGYNIVPYIASAIFGASLFYAPPYHGIQLQYSYMGINLARKDLIEIADERNISTTYWTIDEEEEMEDLVNLGADVITTNSPDILYMVTQEYLNK